MAKWFGIERLLSATSRKALNTWVEPQITPDNAADLGLNPEQPVIYVLQSPSFSNLLVTDEAAQRLKLPRPVHALDSHLLQEKQSYFFLTQETSAQSLQKNRFEYPERFVRLVEAVKTNANLDVQLVPVTIFWGRSPDKEDSLFKIIFSDSWATPNTLKQLVTVALNGNQTFVKFGLPLSVRNLMGHDMSSSLALRKISRVLRVHFRRQREMAIGPDLSHRRNLMHSILQSNAVREAIAVESKEQQMTPELLEEKARAYVNEIAADYSYQVIRGLQITLNWLWNRLYDGINVHHFDTVTDVAQDHEVVYVPCHRSHIDYLLLSYVIFTRGLMPPHIAAGANLNIPVIGPILRRGGAFFLKRSFKGDQLYAAVFTEYLHLITTKGFPIEYFIEGGRSRTGRLLPPKAGMLAMTVKSFIRDNTRPIVFIPTYIGYERLMEGSTYIGELRGASKEQESIWQVLQTTRKIEKIFGKVHLSFGEPIYLEPLLDAENPQWRDTVIDSQVKLPWLNRSVDKLARQINTHINQAAVINPITLLSLVLLSTPNHAIDEDVLVQQLDLYKKIANQLPYSHLIEMTELNGADIISYGVQLKAIQRVKHPLGDLICVADNQAVFLTYFRNNILHLFVLPSLVACLMQHNGQLQREQISAVINSLYPYLKSELFLSWEQSDIEPLVNQHINILLATGILHEQEGQIASPNPNTEHYVQLTILGEAVKETIERYYMTIALLTRRGSGTSSQKQLEDLCSLLAQRLSVLHEFNSPEFFDKAIFRNFIDTLKKVGLLRADEQDIVHFDHSLMQMADQANLVLKVETQHTIQQITSVSDEEITKAMELLARKEKKRKS
ncbi:glycerol-3-phosphate 1-O-acyltransferase PlsB [Agitococcus lubricus]|uniref:Glycerol-3-phosphate acyltransferase n=1 Tax=Agitococcus lubricus TaxID=1077255 RepID=A0A2T5IZ78_9GAMM|nr:glycerol-3-phosphate 1-O-acyltransferase PlsB [Agitococcus lubricus]PTQ89324.1 glycerol-3-phosphate acyltransferase [Agitococcus lubricus]